MSKEKFANKKLQDVINKWDEPRIGNYKSINFIWDELKCTELITKKFIDLIMDDIKTFDSKQRDYGHKNISEFGEYGVLVRCNDKIERLKNLYGVERDTDILLGSGPNPLNEPMEDNWKDLSIYAVIARLCRKGVWPK